MVYIYANIWGIWMLNVTIYSSTMDPMGYTWDTWRKMAKVETLYLDISLRMVGAS